jgi:hypothetical protein
MKQDHLHPPSVSTTPPRTCGSPPFVSTTTPHPCGTPFRLNDTTAHLRSTHLSHRHHRAFAVHSVRFHDIAVHLRFTCFVSTTSLHICGSPTSSHRHRCAFAAHHFVSTTTTNSVSTTPPRICGSPTSSSPTSPCLCGTQVDSNIHWFVSTTTHLSLRHRRTLAVLHFVSPTLPRTCGSPILSPRHRRIFAVLTGSPP